MRTLTDELDHYLAGIAWNSWKELGVVGTDRFFADCLIQPEELIILTAIISQHDPRLRDEALDWCARYHESVSISRLRNILKEMNPDVMHSFSQFAVTLNSISTAKWPHSNEVTSLRTNLSKKSSLTTLEPPSLLMLRLRNLFGPGAKADILTHFLTQNGAHFSASDLTEIGYSKKSLMSALDHLAASGILTMTNIRNMKSYSLNKPRELQVIIGKLPKIAPPWVKILKAIVAIRSILPEIQKNSQTTRGVIFRNCLLETGFLLPTFLSQILQSAPEFTTDWKAVIDIFKAFEQGNFFMQFEVYDNFDNVVFQLTNALNQVDDCVDGLDMIHDKKKIKEERYREVYRDCYQLFLSFSNDLSVRLKTFCEFPIHKMMDERLSDIIFSFSKEKLPQLLKKIEQIQPIDQMSNIQSTNRQYQILMPDIYILQQFIATVRKRIQELYFVKTDIHLLMLPTELYKRHLVLDLFNIE